MMRTISLCLVLLTVACGPSNSKDDFDNLGKKIEAEQSFDSSLDLKASSSKASAALVFPEENKNFPIDADAKLTPGVRCTHPDEMRYPEKIAYCERNVSSATKRSVIATYDDQLGFNMENMNRNAFKIDHYIPLCMGGDNARTNLWPQHQSVYIHTDAIEENLCLVLARGKITQNEAIDQMLYAKAHLPEAAGILAKIKDML